MGRVPVWDDKKFWRQMVVMFHNSVNVLNVPELYTQKWLKCYVLYYIYFTAIFFLKRQATM